MNQLVGYVYTYKLFGGYIPVFKIEVHCTGLPVQSYFSQLITKIWAFLIYMFLKFLPTVETFVKWDTHSTLNLQTSLNLPRLICLEDTNDHVESSLSN